MNFFPKGHPQRWEVTLRLVLDSSQPSIFSYFCSIIYSNAGIESQSNWMLTQSEKLTG